MYLRKTSSLVGNRKKTQNLGLTLQKNSETSLKNCSPSHLDLRCLFRSQIFLSPSNSTVPIGMYIGCLYSEEKSIMSFDTCENRKV